MPPWATPRTKPREAARASRLSSRLCRHRPRPRHGLVHGLFRARSCTARGRRAAIYRTPLLEAAARSGYGRSRRLPAFLARRAHRRAGSRTAGSCPMIRAPRSRRARSTALIWVFSGSTTRSTRSCCRSRARAGCAWPTARSCRSAMTDRTASPMSRSGGSWSSAARSTATRCRWRRFAPGSPPIPDKARR